MKIGAALVVAIGMVSALGVLGQQVSSALN